MARVRIELITALKNTAKRLGESKAYQWGHMGSCNCGFLAQEITRLSKDEIHRMAMERHGDWNEQLNDYCPTSGLPIDDVISELIAFGFDSSDLKHLETLSDPEILRTLPAEKRYLTKNKKEDVVYYLNAWASLLEMKLLEKVSLHDLTRIPV